MVINGVDKRYKEYSCSGDEKWTFANGILYQMCKENPSHDDRNVIVGKIWLIGRSYAAAIERRKNASDSNDDFYYNVVAPKMISIGSELDLRLDKIRQNKGSIEDSIDEILGAHKFLMDTFYELTGLEKRSLASKYLHFHCPDKYFIYDSRARAAINKIVKRAKKELLNHIDSFDAEYGDFVCRMLELQDYLKDNLGVHVDPRKLDSFLLNRIE